ncbi:MAG: hypothetical protein U9Q83_02005 [Bacteroidota bacterium]|nr:hypothetical protein [Bacteroidota bacterium]
MEIRIKVNDSLLSDFGIIYIQEYLQKQIELKELQISANRVSKYLLDEKHIKWEEEFNTAKQEAWDEYKSKFLNTENK